MLLVIGTLMKGLNLGALGKMKFYGNNSMILIISAIILIIIIAYLLYRYYKK